MQRRGGWALGSVVLMATVGLGCGRQNTSRPEQEAVSQPTPVSSSAPPETSSPSIAELPSRSVSTPTPSPTPAPTPSPTPTPAPPVVLMSPDPQWWRTFPEPAPMPENVPACVPVSAPVGTRYPHPCSVKKFGPSHNYTALQRWDVQGHLVEDDSEGITQDGWYHQTLCTYSPHKTQCATSYNYGQTWSSSTQTYDEQNHLVSDELNQTGTRELKTYDTQGHPLRDEHYNKLSTGEQLVGFTEWTYDEAGRLVRQVQGDSPPGRFVTANVYDAQGRLALSEQYMSDDHLVMTQVEHWTRYRYGSQGELVYMDVSNDQDLASAAWGIEQSFTYRSNGQLWQEHQYAPLAACNCYSYQEYDEQGKLLSEDDKGDEFHILTAWTYNTLGQLTEQHVDQLALNEHHVWNSWRYDSAGRLGLKRLIDDGVDNESTTPRRTFTLERYLYTCGANDLVLEEQDTDGDGVSEGTHQLRRDAAGNLLTERFSGSLLGPYSRIEYDYSCFP